MDDQDVRAQGGGDRLTDMERRVERLEGRQGVVTRSRGMLGGIVPEDARQHFRAAGREQLLGVRTLLDHWIERLGSRGDDDRPSRERIDIE